MQAKATQPPKLRAKAAQARGLVPYAAFAAAEFMKSGFVDDTLVADMATELAVCYERLSPAKFHREFLAFHRKRYCHLAVEMERRHDGVSWRLKPKIHLFQELC